MNMSAGNRVPDYQREVKELRAEIRKLWLALAKGPHIPPVQKQMVFSWSGTVSGTRTSGPWFAEDNLTVTGCIMGYASGGGATSAVMLVNGSAVETYVSGSPTRGGQQRRHAVKMGDRIQLAITASGGSDLTATLSYITAGGW